MQFRAMALLMLTPMALAAETASLKIGTGFAAPPAGALILLTPPTVPADELQKGVPLLLEELHRALAARGYRIALLDTANYKLVWSQEVAVVGGMFDAITGQRLPERHMQAVSSLARRLAGETQAALIIMPSFAMRTADLSGTKAAWDGQTRWVPMAGLGGASGEHRGTTRAVSVELLALTGKGQLAFHAFGGAFLPYALNVTAERFQVRTDMFDKPDDVRAGVVEALKTLPLTPP